MNYFLTIVVFAFFQYTTFFQHKCFNANVSFFTSGFVFNAEFLLYYTHNMTG